MRNSILTLSFTVVILVVALSISIVEVIALKNTKQATVLVPEIIKVHSELFYYSGTELNSEVKKIIDSGGSQEIINFFTERTSSQRITSVILNESLRQEVPITAAYSLAWGESRFRENLTNNNGGRSTDWGLFQINDSYRDWTHDEFLDARLNTEEGLKYFSYALNVFEGDIVMAIAGYNKGVENVKNGDLITNLTLVHINNITEYNRRLEADLNLLINRWNNEQ